MEDSQNPVYVYSISIKFSQYVTKRIFDDNVEQIIILEMNLKILH